MLKTTMSSSDFADCHWRKTLFFSGNLLIPTSKKWLRVFDSWSFASIVDRYRIEQQKNGMVEDEGYWEETFDTVISELVACDLGGGLRRENHNRASWFMDVPYDLKGTNLKSAQSDVDQFPSYLLAPA